jgi:hypothetical protein
MCNFLGSVAFCSIEKKARFASFNGTFDLGEFYIGLGRVVHYRGIGFHSPSP